MKNKQIKFGLGDVQKGVAEGNMVILGNHNVSIGTKVNPKLVESEQVKEGKKL